MNGKIDYLIKSIRNQIPPQVLDYAFKPVNSFNQISPNIDFLIREKVIDGRLLLDCNVIAGIESYVDLSLAHIKDYPGGTLVIIPPSATQGKSITSVLSLSFSMGSYYMTNSGNEIVNAVDGITQMTAARIALVGPNTVYIEGGLISTMRYLKCVLENDSELQNISDRSLPLLAKMAVLACKAYIYNQNVIRVEEKAIVQGIELGKISDIINEYIDANEMYEELMNTKLKKVLILNDRVSHSRHIRMLLHR